MTEKIYIATLYSERLLAMAFADQLKAAGHEIVSSWVYGGEEGKTREEIAVLDYNDVKRCTTLILITKPHGEKHSGGGRHVEFGMAYALGRRCMIIGEQEHVFCYLPNVIQCYSMWQAIAVLEGLRVLSPRPTQT